MATARQYQSYEDLARDAGARLAVVQEQIQIQSAMAAGVPQSRLVRFASQEHAIAALRRGSVDAYASTALGNRTLISMPGMQDLVAIDHPARAETPLGAYTFAKSARDLVDAFDAKLRAYLGSPAHLELIRRYGFAAADIGPVLNRSRDERDE
ncbi:hypothetical protein [Polaromonas aquatica]|uniref:hypothetical protein n=1 Tax=Polaromonas aquatica TaxID=332657 RepID=UPI003D647228